MMRLPLVVVMLLAACARRPNVFPEPDQLDKLAAKPIPAKVFPTTERPVERWELEGPFPDKVALVERAPQSRWEQALAEAARARAGAMVLSEDMHCITRETGRFVLANDAAPSRALDDFIAGRCGTLAPSVRTSWFHGEASFELTEDQLFDAWKDQWSRALADKLVGQNTAGVWFGRNDKKALVVLAVGKRNVLVQPIARVPGEDGKVRIQGELLIPAEKTRAVVTKGRYGYARCESDDTVKLPRFSYACPVDRADASARIQMLAFPTGRFLGYTELDVLVTPSGEATRVHERKPPPAVVGEGDVAERLVSQINVVRQQASLPALRLSPTQSQTAASLAPHYFAALAGEAPEIETDVIALGLMAGWRVGESVLYGTFESQWASGDVAELVDAIVAEPVGREAVLDPKLSVVAVGPYVDSGSRTVGVLISGYALAEPRFDEDAVRTIVEKVNCQRAEKGVAPVVWFNPPKDAGARATAALEAGRDPSEVSSELMRETVEVLNKEVSGWVLHENDLEDVRIPEEVITRPSLAIAVVLGRHRPPDHPWTRYIVLLVTADPGRAAK